LTAARQIELRASETRFARSAGCAYVAASDEGERRSNRAISALPYRVETQVLSDIGEAIGTATEGGLLGGTLDAQPGKTGKSRVVDPADPNPAPGKCLNCGATLTGKHCHQCGQKAVVHRSLRTIGHDLMHGVLHLDGKLWRTLPLLALKPGRITRRYIDGERVKFVSPMAMFLFSVFLMFAVFQALGITTPTDLSGADFDPTNVEINDEVASEIETTVTEAKTKMASELEAAEEQLAALPADAPDRMELEVKISELSNVIAKTQEAEQAMAGVEEGSLEFSGTGIDWIDEGLIKKWQANPGLMLYKLQTNFYKFSWALIPISIPFMWLLFFWRRRFKAYDHAIFVTYSLSFMSLLFVTLSVLGAVGLPTAALVIAGVIIPPIHIYKQLRYGYELSRIGAFWRTVALTNGIVIGVLSIFLWLLLLLGAL
jgi:hypothetical protein